ncbi:hypothetical protein CEXT_7681 [Caerostris extrusa]|uniref:Uncharacterized protein n=1 Tax=Caerostris extrusa TaxID=172846 RepID=A0AAV4XTL7_CAEEX|nr:hypothetical protein CEXT_7681 [Caerostris extrusa]
MISGSICSKLPAVIIWYTARVLSRCMQSLDFSSISDRFMVSPFSEYPSNPKQFSVALFHFATESPVTPLLVLGIWRATVQIYCSWTVLRNEGRRVDFECDWKESGPLMPWQKESFGTGFVSKWVNHGPENARFAQRQIQITNPWSSGARQGFRHKPLDPEYPSNPKQFSVALFHFGPRNLSSDSLLVLGIWRATVRIYCSWTVLRERGKRAGF